MRALLPLLLCAPLAAAAVHPIELHVVPPQGVRAVTIRSGDAAHSVEVRDGKALVPADLPLPWSLGMVRFEADSFTRAHLDGKRPWVIRELGIVRGRVERRGGADNDRFTWLFARSGASRVDEIDVVPREGGAFELRLAAGTYDGALLGATSATRIRSGIVVRPGEATDLGAIVPEPAVPISLSVVDAGGRGAVAGARVVWDPPGTMLNSPLSRRLYARRWSAVTDRRGMAEIRGVGPVPHSVRWRVEADGFATTNSATSMLKEPVRFAVPDVQLRPRPELVVHVRFPRDGAEELDNAMLVAAENRDPRTHEFVPVNRVRLREGETRFTFDSYGQKRIRVESAAQKTLVFETLELTAPRTVVELALRQAEVRGRVVHRDKPVAGTLVALADPLNGNQFLAQAPSDDDGRFRFSTWATGKLLLYTIGPEGGPGKRFGNASTTLDLTGRNEADVNLEIPASGFSISVVDDESGRPVEANLDIRASFKDGGARYGIADTDAQGRLDLSGYREGRATVVALAKGYRASTTEVPIRPDVAEHTIRLRRAQPAAGRVVDLRGVPIANASIVGGFRTEHVDPLFVASTDADGRFRFETPPPPDTLFYVTGAGHALGMTTLSSERDTVIALHPPSSSIVTLRQDNKPPDRVFLVLAAPAGRTFIPLYVLENLAVANGMSLFQLCGSSATGDVVLPEFLPPGAYDLFLARRGGQPFLYEKVGTIRTPLARNSILAMASR